MDSNNGAISLGLRYRLAQKAFDHTAVYDRTIADFLGSRTVDDVAWVLYFIDGYRIIFFLTTTASDIIKFLLKDHAEGG